MRRITRITIATIAGAALVGLTPAAAFAGEVTGSGKWTPPHTHLAASECSFSGLEDDPSSPLRTQTPHEVYFGTVLNPPPGTPGTACNPSAGG